MQFYGALPTSIIFEQIARNSLGKISWSLQLIRYTLHTRRGRCLSIFLGTLLPMWSMEMEHSGHQWIVIEYEIRERNAIKMHDTGHLTENKDQFVRSQPKIWSICVQIVLSCYNVISVVRSMVHMRLRKYDVIKQKIRIRLGEAVQNWSMCYLMYSSNFHTNYNPMAKANFMTIFFLSRGHDFVSASWTCSKE